MQGRSIPVDRLEIGLWWQHLHIVFSRHIEGTVPANAEVNPGRLDQVFNLRRDQAWRRRRRRRCDLRRQAIALIGVQDREALEERNGLRFVAYFAGTPLFVGRHKAIGIDDSRAALALADVTTERQRLVEGKAPLTCECAVGGPIRRAPGAPRLNGKWHPESVSIATRRTRGSECSDETGSIAAPGNGAVIAIAASEPLSRVPPARSTKALARGIKAGRRAPLWREEEGSVRKNGACWLWLLLARLTGVGND
ncbi:hypothetical protein CI41S_19310 [Bradyrhizobium ivorense]|nr:hypothetical protein CI41S_19310 [Bradyrhizobium ivorense]